MEDTEMTDKLKRKKRISSGARKGRADRGTSRRNTTAIEDGAGYLFLKEQKRNRWPSGDTMDKAYRLSVERRPGGRRKPTDQKKSIKPRKTSFTLLDAAITYPKALDTLLTAACLQLKRVRRYPGYVLIHTYNLKNRVIEII
jgi:hypothetical protein